MKPICFDRWVKHGGPDKNLADFPCEPEGVLRDSDQCALLFYHSTRPQYGNGLCAKILVCKHCGKLYKEDPK